MNYALFLDDERHPSQVTWVDIHRHSLRWMIVKNVAEFEQAIKKFGPPGFVSFDHDLAVEHYADKFDGEPTGKQAAEFLVQYCVANNHALPAYAIHSMNPAGRERIKGVLDGYEAARQAAKAS